MTKKVYLALIFSIALLFEIVSAVFLDVCVLLLYKFGKELLIWFLPPRNKEIIMMEEWCNKGMCVHLKSSSRN